MRTLNAKKQSRSGSKWTHSFGRALLLSVMAMAQPIAAAEVYHASKIRSVYPLSNGDFVIVLLADSASCTSASSPDYYYVAAGQNGVTLDGVKHMLAVAVAAAAQGLSISFAYDNATSYCYINRLAAQYIE